MPAGHVSISPDGPAPRTRYDIVILGGGLLGAATAALLRRWAPAASVLLAEAGGIPDEGGATVASPGLLPPFEATAGEAGALSWARDWLVSAVTDAAGSEPAGSGAGWLELLTEPAHERAASPLTEVVGTALADAVHALTGLPREHPARLRPGGYLSAEAAALALARRAVHGGTDLALNARVRPLGGARLMLERLALDRRMRLGVHGRQPVAADVVVVACGADGAAVAEAALDLPVRLPAVYRQFPRVRWAAPAVAGTAIRMPVVALGEWAVRPAPGGALLVPPPGPADPDGYRPTGGRLLGVPVGVRREVIERLLDEPALQPLVASGRLDLGKSVRAVRGARFSAPPDGRAVVRDLGGGWWLLAGGELGLAHDVAAAARLAAAVAGVPVPW